MAAVAAVVGWVLFVLFPDSTAELLGVILVVLAVVVGLRIGGNVAGSLLPGYNVAEVAVEGPITRDVGGFPPGAPGTPGADDIVDLIERADEDGSAEALLLRLDTPGGTVVPSDDIRLAAERFDGPTVAYTRDICASGGYWIASGCDELWAREGSIVGSIGVRGSRVTASELLEKAGLEYERLAAGEYKEAGTPFADLEEDERAYLQGLVDDYYEQFLETTAEGRDMNEEHLRLRLPQGFLVHVATVRGGLEELLVVVVDEALQVGPLVLLKIGERRPGLLVLAGGEPFVLQTGLL